MHPELLLLSAQIALLVLIASLVAFAIGWMLRGGRAQAGAEAEAKLTQASQEIESLKASLASTEQQCMTTLEQRDEAERQASQSAAEVRLLGDELARLNTASISITDHQAQLDQARAAALQSIEAKLRDADQTIAKLSNELAEAKSSHNTASTEATQLRATIEQLQRDLDALRRDTVPVKDLEAAQTSHQQAEEEARKLREELERLRATTIARSEHETALTDLHAKLDATGAMLPKLRDELEQLRASTIARKDHEAALNEWRTKLEAAEAALAEARAVAPMVQPEPPAVAPTSTRTPFIPPAPITPVTESSASDDFVFPPAPVRDDVRTAMFRESDLEAGKLTPADLVSAHATLDRLESELEDKERTVAALTSDHAQALDALQRTDADDKAKLKITTKHEATSRKHLDNAVAERDRLRSQLRSLKRSITLTDGTDIRRDNLMLIKGVKDVINRQLHTLGIFSYKQIAAWDEQDIDAFSDLLAFKQRIRKDRWQQQARDLHEARYGERLP